jgi:putative SOS response-associated peptidase YedK
VKASFRNAMRWRRCLVPAHGFYEWTGEKGKRRPFLLRPREPHLIAFAGIYKRWRDGKGDENRHGRDSDLPFKSHRIGAA